MEKVILITGASGGLGRQMAEHFAQAGYTLALHYLTGETRELSGRHKWFQADLRNAVEIDSLIDQVFAEFGGVDVLINNAGISRNGMSWKLNQQDWDDVLSVNLTAPFLLSAKVLPGMRERNHGRIINISSVVAQTGVAGTAAYAASKAGLIGLTKTLAKETATSGISVNALALGYFDTGMISEVSEPILNQILQSIPKKELGRPEVILKTLDFLLTDSAEYVTGQTINLNGGMFG